MALYNKHLDSFIRVVDKGSFAGAAEELFISSNALIKQINLLERDLGFKLLDRSNKGVQLTAAGQYTYDEARRLIVESNRVEAHARILSNQPAKKVRFGISPMRPLSRVMQFWQAAQLNHPDIDIELISFVDDIHTWPRLFAQFGELIDVIVSPLPSKNQKWFANCNFRPLYKAEAVCMTHADHPLAERKHIRLDDLSGYTLYACARGYSPETDELWSVLETDYPMIQLMPYEPYDLANLNEFASSGDLMYLGNRHMGVYPGFKYIPFEEDIGVTMGLLYGKNCTDAVTEFVDAIVEVAERQAADTER